MSRLVRLINGKGDWTATPPTGASDGDLYQMANDFIVSSGVLDKDGGDGLVSELDSVGFGVKVKAGTIYVLNSSWTKNSFEPKYYQVIGDSDENVTVASNSSGDERIDLVAQKLDKITTPNDDGTNVSPLVVIQGTPGDGAPALPDDHELLATLTLPDGYAAVTNAMITDNREQIYIKPSAFNSGFTVLNDAVTITADLQNGVKDKFFTTVGGNRNIAFANAPVGKYFNVVIEQDGTGSRAYVFTASILWQSGDAPDKATDAGAIDNYVFVKLASGVYLGALAAGNLQ